MNLRSNVADVKKERNCSKKKWSGGGAAKRAVVTS